MKNVIYSIQDLKTKAFDDEEIDIVQDNLIYSLIIGMFQYANIDIPENKILKLIKTEDNWFDNYFWTSQQKTRYQKDLNKIFYNLYRFGPNKCQNSSDDFLMRYGFLVKSKKYDNKK